MSARLCTGLSALLLGLVVSTAACAADSSEASGAGDEDALTSLDAR